MIPTLLSIWNDVQWNGGTRQHDVTDWIKYTYTDSIDDSEGAELILSAQSEALPFLQQGSVIRIRNEYGRVYEHRVMFAKDSLGMSSAVMLAAPISHDLARAFITTSPSRGRPAYKIEGVMTPGQWYDAYVAPALVREGLSGYFSKGDMELGDTIQLSVDRVNVRRFLLDMVEGTEYGLYVERHEASSKFRIHIKKRTSASTPEAFVGRNVVALDREINAEPQGTVIAVHGVAGGSPEMIAERATISDVPWKVTAQAGAVVTIADPRDPTGDAIIEDDQVNGLALNASLEGFYANLAGLASTAGGARSGLAYCPTNNCLYVIRANVVEVFDLTTKTHVTSISVGTGPIGICYASTSDKLFVSNGSSNNVSVINPGTNTVVSTIGSVGTTPGAILYHAGQNRVFVACGSNNVYPINATSYALGSAISGGGLNGPGALVHATASDRIWVGNFGSSTITIIDPSALTASSGPTTSSSGATVKLAYLSATDVVVASRTTVIDTFNATAVTDRVKNVVAPGAGYRFLVGAGTWALAIGPYGASDAFAWINADAVQDTFWVDTRTFYQSTSGSLNPALIPDATGLVWVVDSSVGVIFPFDLTTGMPQIRVGVTDSAAATQQITTNSAARAALLKNRVWFTNADGTLLTSLGSPSRITAGYGRRNKDVTSEKYRGERNLVQAGETRDWTSATVLQGTRWTPPIGVGDELRWYAPDAVGGTAIAALANGLQNYTASPLLKTLAMDGFSASLILQPGDMVQWGSAYAMILARGTGPGTYRIASAWSGALADNTALTIHRPLQTAIAPFGGQALGLPTLKAVPSGATATDDLFFEVDVPWLAHQGLSLHWALTYQYWSPVANLNPANVSVQWQRHGYALDASGVQLSQVSDTNAGLGSGLFSREIHGTVLYANPGRYAARVRLNVATSPGVVAYPTRLVAWLSANQAYDVTPAVGLDVAHGLNLWNIAQLALVELRDPLLAYTVKALEEDPLNPWEVGATATLRDPTRLIYAQPKVRGWRRTLPPPGSSTPSQPEVDIDNRPGSLIRSLVSTGSL